MTNHAIIKATYSDMRMVRSRKCLQLIMEVPIEQAEQVLSVLGIPQPAAEQWCAIALLNEQKAAPQKEHQSWDECGPVKQAAIRCSDPQFQKWVNQYTNGFVEESAEGAASWIRQQCAIDSRSELATNEAAARVWSNIDAEFCDWLYG